MARVPGGVPAELLRRPLRVIRPADAGAVYAHPRPEIARLTRSGVLHKLATGYYAVVPEASVGQPWQPSLEAAGLGMAAADEGADTVAVMGVSAARLHGALPRAVGVAVVAALRHRRTLRLVDRAATVLFVRRKVADLDVQRHSFDLGTGWVTTVEQTALDLIARPALGAVPDEAVAAARALLPRADEDLLHDLAVAQRRCGTLVRFLDA
ncbi:MAG: hypothetical protein GEV07_09160 [Streptosporangiales bacterium]|nr:hypothetical protein [Streptosporangiales bacterium]